MWAAVIRFLTPIVSWAAKVLLLPIIMDFIAKYREAQKEKLEREKAHKEIEDSIKKISDSVTPEEQEAALEEFTRKARARRNNS